MGIIDREKIMREIKDGPELAKKTLKFTNNMSQLMNIISNEPSLGLYRIQEHIRKSIPKLENQTKKLEDCSTVMKDLNYTMENAQHSIISVENSNQSLNIIEHNLVELNNILSAAQM